MGKVLFLVFLIGCTDRPEVKPHRDNNEWWVCEAREGYYVFSGRDAETRAHERCDSFLLPYEKLNQGKKNDHN